MNLRTQSERQTHASPGAGHLSAQAAGKLAASLRQMVAGEVRFGSGDRALYATDGSNYRQVPIGVVIPESTDDVTATLAVAARHGAPVLPRGCGTSLAGQCCNTAVVLDMSKYLNRIVSLDAHARRARVEPGCVLDQLRDAAERHGLTFGPDPSTHDHATLGGMIGNNSCGVHSVMAGRTADNVESLEVVTYRGERLHVGPTGEDELERLIRAGGVKGGIYRKLRDLRDRYADEIRQRYPPIPRRVSGFNLDALLPENGFNVAKALVGSEGTCVTVLGAELALVPSPPHRALVVLGYPDVFAAGDHVPQILGFGPVGLEGIDDRLIDYMTEKHMHPAERTLLPEGRGWLLVEFGGDSADDAMGKARALKEALHDAEDPPSVCIFDDPAQAKRIWEIRESGLGATAHVPGMRETYPGWEDAAVPPDRVGRYLRDFRTLLERYGYGCSLYGHFGDGCIHVRIDFDLTHPDGVVRYRRFAREAAELVMAHGGSLSGEHGDGQARGELLPMMFGETLVQAFREFKSIWDPDGMMNPGKVVDADRMDEHLREGPDYVPPSLETVFAFSEDDHSFARSATRCVGIGNCRRTTGGVMCPSYRATLEEKHSTRGRARLLFEMVHGGPIQDGWRSDAVREALDLCLACKGCRSDCPVNVDMATYKAEFFHHYYKGRLRPRSAYAMGRIQDWCRIAAYMPRLANLLTQSRPLAAVGKRIGGIAPQRRLPPFAHETFRQWFARRAPRPGGQRVLLWPDTFTNYFQPHIGRAAVAVLEAAGAHVVIPTARLCCGRPLYGWGMLDRAKHELGRILDHLRDDIDAGTPLIGLEPACLATFRDELPNLFPTDERAHKLCRQSVMLSEYLERIGYRPGHHAAAAVVHPHCNHHAVIGLADERSVLDKLGLDYHMLDAGCCGMAGAFGFEAEHYEVSINVGEHQLLPAIRGTRPDALIIADGFSCREQIEQCTGRHALHVAEVLEMALTTADGGSR